MSKVDPHSEGYQTGYQDASNEHKGIRINPYGAPSTSDDAYEWHLGYSNGWDDRLSEYEEEL